jgi:hypothetical protein
MPTAPAAWDLLALMRVHVGEETDPAKVRAAAEAAIAEYRARTRARWVQDQAHAAYVELLHSS